MTTTQPQPMIAEATTFDRKVEILPGMPPIEFGPQRGRITREYLHRAREVLCGQHLAGASGAEIVQRWTAVVDHVVRSLFETARDSYQERGAALDRKCAVIAQGGYGRGELNPQSDIDILFLYTQRIDAYVDTITESILYPLWDSGMTVGQATRTVRECVQLANSDFKVKTSLLDTRLIAGDADLFDSLVEAMDRDVLKKNPNRFYKEQTAASRERHRKHGDAVFLVEPQIKEGEGGLRDIHTATWLAKVKYRVRSLEDLVVKGVLLESELREIIEARGFLFRVRNALHFLSGQHLDQLTFEYQERIAADLGFTGDGAVRGVEHFMRDYYYHAGVLKRFCDDMIARCSETRGPSHWVGRLASREIRAGVRIVAEELVVSDERVLDDDPSLLLRVFADAQRHGVPFHGGTKRLLRAKAENLATESARRSPAAARAFLDVLTWKYGVHDSLAMMHRLGVLGAYLPEFEYLRCMAQYDRYHIYTVDEHTLRAVQNIEAMRNGIFKAEHPLLTSVAREIEDIEILYLAMLYHDIGKGRGGDHSNRGADMALATAQRLGLNADATAQFEFLVRYHLLMHHLATRRDIHEPNVTRELAQLVGSPETLGKLYVLTYADLKATNPKLWNSWHAMLLGELYELTLATLDRGSEWEEGQRERATRIRNRVVEATTETERGSMRAFLRQMPDRYLLATPEDDIPRHFVLAQRLAESGDPFASLVEQFPEREFTQFTVVTRNRPGLFAKLSGVLRAKGMNVAGAQAATAGSGLAIDVFRVTHSDDRDIARSKDQWDRVLTMIREVLEGSVDIEQIVQQAHRPPTSGERYAPRVATEIQVDNTTSSEFTFVGVTTADRLGVLYALTRTMFHLGLRIHLAKVTTSVDRVFDVFYVSNECDAKIADDRLGEVRAALTAALRPDPEREPAETAPA